MSSSNNVRRCYGRFMSVEVKVSSRYLKLEADGQVKFLTIATKNCDI